MENKKPFSEQTNLVIQPLTILKREQIIDWVKDFSRKASKEKSTNVKLVYGTKKKSD